MHPRDPAPPPSHTHVRLDRVRRRLLVAVDAELDLTIGPGQPRLGHADAGIHRDPDTDRLCILAPEGGQE